MLLFFFLPAMATVNATEKEFDIVNYGAKPDGKTLNTEAIQKAIDAAAIAGGTVVVPQGRFLTGSIILKSNVHLRLEKDAVLLGSTNPENYKRLNRWPALILADGQENISITGQGTIDGQGRRLALNIDSLFYAGELDSSKYTLRRKRPNESVRPQDIEMAKCKNVLIQGITIRNAASWVQTYHHCENLTFDQVHVDSDAYWNNDGFDISDCKDVRVSNCVVNAADDGICLKSHVKGTWNENVLIENCTVRSSASAIKFGTASRGGFKNVTIRNIKVYDTFRSAIAIESVDGGELENILVDGIDAVNTGNAIFIRLGHRNAEGDVGYLKNVTIKNVKVQVAFDRPDINYEVRGPEPSFFHNTFPSTIAGIPGHRVENVLLENIEITFPGKGNDGLAYSPVSRLNHIPEQEADYPEFSMFGELPAWGFYVRHVKGLRFKNVTVKAEHRDYRPAFVFDDVESLSMEQITVVEDDTGPQVILKDVKDENLKMDRQMIQTIR